MRAIWNGFITFGLITLPVSIGVAQKRQDVSFRTLGRESMTPVRQRRWDETLDRALEADEVVRGYEFAKGRYVAVEDAELERFAARQEKTIRIDRFVIADEVDPVMFERAYWVAPGERAERPYALLLAAMERTGHAALGRFVLSTKEHPVLLRPHRGALTLQTLFYGEDVRSADQFEIASGLGGVTLEEGELQMAEALVRGLAAPAEVESMVNQTRAQLVAYLEQRAAGEEPELAEEAAEPAPVVDLMAALSASLAGLEAAGQTQAQAAAAEDEVAAAG